MTTDERSGTTSSYLSYLPAIFQQDVEGGAPNLLGRFLLACEHVLTGLDDRDTPGIEEILDGIADQAGRDVLAGVQRYFDPGRILHDSAETIAYRRAPAEFLTWLAGWVALWLRADMDELRQRDLIARAVSLYRIRGTRRGLEEMIKIYTRLPPQIDEQLSQFQLGVHARIGEDTILDGGPPYFFKVTLRLSDPNPEELRRQREIATAIIDMEKPAHTYYQFIQEVPAFQIGDYSHLGVDTLLGTKPAKIYA
jgi:phage tail-like protein